MSNDQTDAGNRYALKALKDKRASLAGQVAELQRQLRYTMDTLAHVDATIVAFEPGFDPTTVRAVKPYKRMALFKQGELGRSIIDAIRRAGRPLSAQDVTTELLKAGGHDDDARPALVLRVRAGLKYLEKGRKVVRIPLGNGAMWKLADSGQQ